MSSTARQLPRSKAGVSFYLIGAALVGISLLGFIYSFLPRKTNSSEIDLGSQFSRLPGMAMAPSLEKLIELTAKMAGESWIYMGAPMQNSAARNHKPAKENTNVRLE